ncbi:DUF4257 domain-containing protein [Bacillus alkalicellulosilyticus]|uniref:DUF4257 domain-containing protein n=1 Tax=Alkalihalobacterium alkalicellulosilyticum TaxID=1912214 RepID=UPI000996EACE|nr:DUF4257 domain-containing protein [Bacillus alkalicellulosilyticus]
MLQTLLIAGLVGGLTGVIYHLIRNGKSLVYPRKRDFPKGIYLGFYADFLIGVAAAIFAVTYLPVTHDLKTVIGVSILAGMSAENILLQRELKTEKAKTEGLERINERLNKN